MSISNKIIDSKWYDNLLFYLNYGKPKNKISLHELRKQNFKQLKSPIFILSTGRCGTNWLANLLEKDKSLKVFHEPKPVMRAQAKLAYQYFRNDKINQNEKKIFEELYLTGREEIFLNCARAGKRMVFVDSGSCFFAYIYMKLFPDAKFVHLYRHPAEFVRSGMRRKWYNYEKTSELNRITPLEETINWVNYSLIQKISWLWNETNSFIEEFTNKLKAGNIFKSNFNEWNFENVKNLIMFLDIKIDDSKIKSSLSNKVNSQKDGNFSEYKNWTETDKSELKSICSTLATKYGYEL